MKNLIKNISWCDIYVVLYVMYIWSNMFIRTSFSAMVTYIPMTLILLYVFFVALLKLEKTKYIRALLLFVIFLSIYGFLHWIKRETVEGAKPTNFLFGNFHSLVPVLLFYIFTFRQKITENKMHFYFFVLLALNIVSYFNYFSVRDVEVEGSVGNVTNNIGYLFLDMLPLVFLFWRKKLLQFLLFVILLFFVMSGMKRGSIIIAAVFLIYFIVISIRNDTSIHRRRNSVLIPFLIIGSGIVIYYFVQNIWLNNDYFFKRLEDTTEGFSSGRDSIYSKLWFSFISSNSFLQMLFGRGAEGTLRVLQIHAHNDWLELLTDCGLIGVLVYLYYFICMIGDCRKFSGIKPESYVLISCLIILFMKSLFSMSFMSMSLGLSSAIGYGMAQCQIKPTQTFST